MTSIDRLAALDALPGVRAAFLTRIPDVDVDAERDVALARLRESHDRLAASLGLAEPTTAEQVHGRRIARVDAPTVTPAPAADGLITNHSHLTLGIYVADCAAIFLVDPVRRAIGLVHSGRKGTELNIVGEAILSMRENYATDPADLVVAVAPCIRPPHYEVDFAATIAAQAHSAGVRSFHDDGTCTAANPGRYYSYRREKGRTGRMLALLALV